MNKTIKTAKGLLICVTNDYNRGCITLGAGTSTYRFTTISKYLNVINALRYAKDETDFIRIIIAM